MFRDDLFGKTCQHIETRNEAMVIRDIGLLLVPSGYILATYDDIRDRLGFGLAGCFLLGHDIGSGEDHIETFNLIE